MPPKRYFKISNRITLSMGIWLFIITLVTTAASYWHISSIVKTLIADDLEKYIALKGERESQTFELAKQSQQSLLSRFNEISQDHRLMPDRQIEAKFWRLFERFPDGAIRDVPTIDNLKHPSYFIPRSIKLNKETMRSALAIYDFLDRECYLTLNTFSDCWIGDADQSLGVLLPASEGYTDSMHADFKNLDQIWMKAVDPANDPQRQPKWTSAYFDPNIHVWLVTLSTPMYNDDKYIGAIGNDIILGKFVQRIMTSNLTGTTSFVFDKDGLLIAHPKYEDQIIKAAGTLKISDLKDEPSIQATALAAAHLDKSVVDLDGDNLVAITKVAGPDWYLATLYPKALIAKAALNATRFILLIGCLSLLLELFLLIQIVRNKLARPLNQLVDVLEKVGGGDLKAKASIHTNDEFEMLGDAFNEMTQKLEVSRSELEVAMQKAISAAKSQSDFVSNVSHEMRNPLNGIVGMAQFLSESQLNEDQTRYASFITESSNHLLTVINRVLDVSKIEAHKFEIEEMPFRIETLLDEVRAITIFSAEKKSLELRFDSSGIPARVVFMGDVARIKQILINLISNAVKFSDKGLILIEVKLSGERGEASLVTFSIRDQGIGMSEAVQGRLFEAFSQGDSSMSRRYGGTGLGLYLVKSFVHLLKGQVGVNSTVGNGAEFWFEIPLQARLAEAEIVAVPSTLPPPREPRSHVKPVLMVDDMPINRTITEAFLKRLGLVGVHCENGQCALEQFEADRFSIILMDCQMPVMDGYEATRLIRAKEAGRSRIPIIAFTANTQESDRRACLAAGMDDMISKPIQFAVFKATIENWLTVATERTEAAG